MQVLAELPVGELRWLPLASAPFVGSFLGVMIERLPQGRPLIFSRSSCNVCGATLRARELVPLFSYALQRGTCRHCRAAIGAFPFLVELAAVAVALIAMLADPHSDRVWGTCLLGWPLLALAWIDWRWMLLPDLLTLPLILAGLLVTWWVQPAAVPTHAAAAVLGYLALCGIAWAYRLFRGHDGVGLGDAKLLAAAGAWLGPAALPWVVAFSALLGIAVAGVFALSGRRVTTDTALPFGTFLAAAVWLMWLHGGTMINAEGAVW